LVEKGKAFLLTLHSWWMLVVDVVIVVDGASKWKCLPIRAGLGDIYIGMDGQVTMYAKQ
jgi:hypothetical protein